MNSTVRGNLAGIGALILWSTMVGLIRSVTDAFGVAAGTALIYSVGAALLFIRNGMPEVRKMPRIYLFGVGSLFVLYEIALSQGVGMAENARQTLEVGMLNYLWPCLTVVFSIWINKMKLRWLVWPGTALAAAGLYWCFAANSGLDFSGLSHNVRASPLPYVFGMTAAVTWALYCNFSVRYSRGHNAVPVFFAGVALVLWMAFFLRGEELRFPGFGPLCQLLVIGVIVGFSYSLWEHALHNGNFIILAVCSYFTPAASMLFAALWLNAVPPLGYWGGVGMVIAGSLLCWRSSVNRNRTP